MGAFGEIAGFIKTAALGAVRAGGPFEHEDARALEARDDLGRLGTFETRPIGLEDARADAQVAQRAGLVADPDADRPGGRSAILRLAWAAALRLAWAGAAKPQSATEPPSATAPPPIWIILRLDRSVMVGLIKRIC